MSYFLALFRSQDDSMQITPPLVRNRIPTHSSDTWNYNRGLNPPLKTPLFQLSSKLPSSLTPPLSYTNFLRNLNLYLKLSGFAPEPSKTFWDPTAVQTNTRPNLTNFISWKFSFWLLTRKGEPKRKFQLLLFLLVVSRRWLIKMSIASSFQLLIKPCALLGTQTILKIFNSKASMASSLQFEPNCI